MRWKQHTACTISVCIHGSLKTRRSRAKTETESHVWKKHETELLVIYIADKVLALPSRRRPKTKSSGREKWHLKVTEEVSMGCVACSPVQNATRDWTLILRCIRCMEDLSSQASSSAHFVNKFRQISQPPRAYASTTAIDHWDDVLGAASSNAKKKC